MSTNCGHCDVKISEQEDSIKCSVCCVMLHVSCSGLDINKKASKRNFRCSKCQGGAGGGVNVAVPAAGNSDLDDTSSKSSILKAIKDLSENLSKQFDSRLEQTENKIDQNIKNKFESIEQSISELRSTFQSKIDNIISENQSLHEEVKLLKNNYEALSKQFTGMKSELQDMQQYSRLQNIEIVGIPVSPNENIMAILEAVAKAINVPFSLNYISAAHRLGAARGQRVRPPSIVVRFVSRVVRGQWLQAAKQKKNLDAVHISSAYRPSAVFLNEHLTNFTKSLLSQARTMVKDKQLAFAWTKDTRVLVKVTADGRARRIRNHEDLVNIAEGGDGK